MLCGFSLGGVLLLRPNMISLWIVYCIAILIDCIKNKKYQELKSFIIYFILGLLIILLPFIIWLFVNGALLDFWNQYIIFNFKYTKVSEKGIGWIAKIQAFASFTLHIVSMMSLLSATALCIIKKKKNDFIYFIYIILTLILISISGNRYGHYGMIILPMVIYPLAAVLNHPSKYVRHVAMGVCIYSFIIFVVPGYFKIIKTIPDMYKHRHDNQIMMATNSVVNLVEENTLTDDAISVYGNTNIIYVLSHRRHATKYSYLYPITRFNKDIKDEYFKELSIEKPKIIIVMIKREDNDIKEFLDDNHYVNIYDDLYYAKAYKLEN